MMLSRTTGTVALGLFCLSLPFCALAAPGWMVLRHNQDAAARTEFRAALQKNPTDADTLLKHGLAVTTGSKSALDLAPEIDEAPILAAAAHLKPEPGTSAVILLDEGRTVLLPNFASLTQYHQIIKLLDPSAVQHCSKYPLSRPTSTSKSVLESARVIKASGKVENAAGTMDHGVVLFPSLAPGDMLDISYRVEDSPPIGLPHQFWIGWIFDSLNVPNHLSRYVLIAPPRVAFATQDHGSIPSPTVRDQGAWRIREWRMANVPARRHEALTTEGETEGIWLDISTIRSWGQVAQWYANLSAPRCIPDSVVRAKAVELTHSAATEDEKLRAIGTYVARSIDFIVVPFRLSGYIPKAGKDVIREHLGDSKDKAALLSALLAAVGIKSELVLFIGRSQGLPEYLPSPRFGDAMVLVQTAHGPLFVDALTGLSDPLTLPAEAQQISALVIGPETTGLIKTPLLPVESTLSTADVTATLSAEGTLQGTFDWTLTGHEALGMRSVLQRIPEAKHEEATRSLASFLLKNCVAESGSITNITQPALPLQFRFLFHLDHYGSSSAEIPNSLVENSANHLLPLPWPSATKNGLVAALLAEPNRTEDLDVMGLRGCTRDTAHIALPLGIAIQDLPADLHQESPFGSFQMHYEVKGKLLTATRSIVFTMVRVPAQDVSKYAAFLQAMDDAMARPIVLKKE